jgi:hypothetical protein
MRQHGQGNHWPLWSLLPLIVHSGDTRAESELARNVNVAPAVLRDLQSSIRKIHAMKVAHADPNKARTLVCRS